MIEHVEIGDRWEVGDPTPVPPDANIRASKGEKLSSLFQTVVHVDDYDLIRAQQSDEEKISCSRVGLARIGLRTTFWAGKAGRDTHPSAKKRSNWNTILEVLGFVNNSHTLQISVAKKKKAQAIQMVLVDDWPRCRRRATAQEVFSIAGKLWNLTYVIRAGKYFVWRLLSAADQNIAPRHDNMLWEIMAASE